MPAKCKWCSQECENARELQNHLRTDIARHPYFCQRCGLNTKNHASLKKHFEISPRHDSANPIEGMTNTDSYCLPCRRQFKSVEELTLHFSFVHEERKCCPQCEKWFSTTYACRSHMASPVHNPPIIPCPHCSRMFKTTSGVAHHLESKRLKKVTEMVVEWDSENQNQITDRVYTDRIREVDSDDDEDTILVMKRNPGLEKVLRMLATPDAWNEEAQAYLCPVGDCEQGFRKLPDLNRHLRSQKHRTDPSTFRCPRCSKRSGVVSSLIQHLESKACGLSGGIEVNQIYTGMHDMFKRLLTV